METPNNNHGNEPEDNAPGENTPDQPDNVAEIGVDSLKAAREKSESTESTSPTVQNAVQTVGQALQSPNDPQFLDLSEGASDLYVPRTETYALGVDAVRRHIGTAEADEVQGELERIDAIEPGTIFELRIHEKLSPLADSTARQLQFYGVNADHLTPDEARSVADFAADATPEIVERKVETIYDAFMRHVNGGRSRRDGLEPAYYDEAEFRRKTDLQDKFKAYQDGKIDLERGFDVEAVYRRLIEEGYDESSYLRRHLEEEDLDVLMDEGLVGESDLFVYGPFTELDLDGIEADLSESWTDVTRPRFNGGTKKVGKRRREISAQRGVDQPSTTLHSGSSLAQLLGETIPVNANGIEQDLIHSFVATEILQNRRLSSKATLATSVSLAFDVLDLPELVAPEKPVEPEKPKDDSDEETMKKYDEEKKEYDKKKKKYDDEMEDYAPDKLEYDEARVSVGWLAYYSAELLGYRHDDMKKRYGSQRPISRKFFDKVMHDLAALKPSDYEYMDEQFKQTLTKMDEHMCDIMYNLAALGYLPGGPSSGNGSDPDFEQSSDSDEPTTKSRPVGDDYD